MNTALRLQVFTMPPHKIVSAVAYDIQRGRYEVEEKAFVDTFDKECELKVWLQYCNMIPMLIDRVLKDIKDFGICILRYKGIVIRDTQWKDLNRVVLPEFIPMYFPTYNPTIEVIWFWI